jgi:hypothetical protein
MARIIDIFPAGTTSVTVAGTLPETYFRGTLDEYEEWLQAVRADDGTRPSHQADFIAGSVEPEETFEEYLERHGDE